MPAWFENLPPASLREQLGELERELKLRERVYPRWVREGRMTEEAGREQCRRLAGAIKTISRLLEKSEPKLL